MYKCTEGNLRFKIDWTSLIFGRKFVSLCFTLYLRAISKYKSPGGLFRNFTILGFQLAGLSLRGGGQGFPPPAMNVILGYFHRKIEEK